LLEGASAGVVADKTGALLVCVSSDFAAWFTVLEMFAGTLGIVGSGQSNMVVASTTADAAAVAPYFTVCLFHTALNGDTSMVVVGRVGGSKDGSFSLATR
jgi:hypothetical protein